MRGRLVRWAGGVSLAAGAIHGGVTAQHFAEWWGYGAFFVAAATGQVVLGLALLTDAVNPRDAGPSWPALWRGMLWSGIVGNALIVLLYVVTRTVGIPLLGPEAGQIEAVSGIDVLATLLELATVALLVRLLGESPTSSITMH